jgi:hypothetical protein
MTDLRSKLEFSAQMRPECPHPGRRLPTLLAALATVVVLLAGCGSSSSENGLASKSPEEILAASKNAAAAAASVHVHGSIINENKPISLDMDLVAGKGAKGRISLEGLEIELIALENAYYLNGSAAFYRHVAGPSAAQLLQGRWLKAPVSSGNFGSLSQLTNLGDLTNSTLGNHGKLAKSGTRTIAGQKAIAVTDTTYGGTLYVAATGTPYPLQIAKGGKNPAVIAFGSWNQPVTITAPSNAINITQLQNGR